jgi:putative endonuclease
VKPHRDLSRADEIHAARARLGAAAEDAVADYLRARGVEVIARNVRVGRLEIDLIARDGPVIAIIEVRTRGPGSFQRALDSIDARKRARIRRAGEALWRTRFSGDASVERMRFDVASVTFPPEGGALVEHVKAAF